MSGHDHESAHADREVVLTRTLDAPAELVWRAWTDPARIGRWWGPNGFTTTTHEMDVRPGGVWRFDMHGPDGRDYANRVVFDEVVEAERIAYTHTGDEDVEAVCFRSIVTFERDGELTRMTFRMIFRSAEDRERVAREYGAIEGLTQTVERLAAGVAEETRGRRHTLSLVVPSSREIMLARSFDAPRTHVFDALTRPDMVRRWCLGPEGWTMPVCEIDLRVGGRYRYEWRHADGRTMGMGGVYREIVPPQRLVTTERFDEAWYPGEAVITTTLIEHDGVTMLTSTMLYESAEARDAVLGTGMERGVGASYDRIDELVGAGAAP